MQRRKLIEILYGLFLLLLVNPSILASTKPNLAPVSGMARSFLLNKPIANANITILETGEEFKTDSQGNFGPIYYPVGKPITLIFQKWGYKTTQSETINVPQSGLMGPYQHITFQIPSIITYHVFANIIGAKIDDDACHVATTIIAHQKTLDDLPQGEPEAEVILSPLTHENPFYFGIFIDGPFKDKTNPFTKGLLKTSEDGGVVFFNLPPSNQPYVLSAKKAGITFSKVQFLCRKGMFINISPPRGPMVQK